MWDSIQRHLLGSFSRVGSVWPNGPAEFSGPFESDSRPDASRLKVLVVVAHPDDDSECAATLYRITHEMGGTVDQVVITNGEGGHQYSAPAQIYYSSGSDQLTWRKRLVRVRREELKRAGLILGIRRFYFLDQSDTGFTFDPYDAINAWDVEYVRQQLLKLLTKESYDLVLVLLPSPHSHGHHQTTAILVLETIAQLKEEQRPMVMGVQTGAHGDSQIQSFRALNGFPLTRTTTGQHEWNFDRRTPMRCHPALNYTVVANWVIAEHKSQGMFQMEFSRRTHEYYWRFEISSAAGATRCPAFQEFTLERLVKASECSA